MFYFNKPWYLSISDNDKSLAKLTVSLPILETDKLAPATLEYWSGLSTNAEYRTAFLMDKGDLEQWF